MFLVLQTDLITSVILFIILRLFKVSGKQSIWIVSIMFFVYIFVFVPIYVLTINDT
jgi:hypothetical protein